MMLDDEWIELDHCVVVVQHIANDLTRHSRRERRYRREHGSFRHSGRWWARSSG